MFLTQRTTGGNTEKGTPQSAIAGNPQKTVVDLHSIWVPLLVSEPFREKSNLSNTVRWPGWANVVFRFDEIVGQTMI